MSKAPISSDPYEAEPAGRGGYDDQRKQAQNAADRMNALQHAIKSLLERSNAEIAAAEREADALLAAADEYEVDAALESAIRKF